MIDAESVSQSVATRAASLFRGFRAGDETKMADLVALLTPLLWHTVRAQRLDAQTAEDVVQTTWLTLVRNADSIADPQAVLKWLIVSARREAWRVVKRSDRVEPREFQADDITAAPQDRPEEQVLRGDGDSRLWQHLSELTQRCQELLRVIAFADRPDYAAVAEALDMPVGSIGPTRGRCLAKLRQLLMNDPAWEL
jgi:RNA polymerase sigma factor (sigma-70 family)